MRKMRCIPLPMREAGAKAVSGLWPATMRLSLCRMRKAPVHLRAAKEGEGEARRRKGPADSAHGGDEFLASRRHSDERPAIHGSAIRQAARILPERRGAARALERTSDAPEATGRAG